MEVDENIKWVKIDENGLKYIKSVEINDKRWKWTNQECKQVKMDETW